MKKATFSSSSSPRSSSQPDSSARPDPYAKLIAAKSPETGGVRFAPSPTGHFHLGNLRTAWISHVWSKALGLPWVVRFEDIDRPRVIAGAQASQLADLKSLGLVPDLVLQQTNFYDRHLSVFLRAVATGQVYRCNCSRKDVQIALANLASAPHDGQAPVYSGHCRKQNEFTHSPSQAHAAAASAPNPELNPDSIAWRFRMPDESGRSDFIIARSSSTLVEPDASRLDDARAAVWTPAYHWACAIDDFDGRYDLLVRASDLSPAVPVQRAIQNWLVQQEPLNNSDFRAWQAPAVFHTSLVTQNDGHRLEKRSVGVTLAELTRRGLSSAKMVESFASSFDHSALRVRPKAGEIFGEDAPTITLRTLGFEPD